MKTTPHPLSPGVRQQQHLALPAVIAAFVFNAFLIFYGLTFPPLSIPSQANFGLGLAGAAYTLLNAVLIWRFIDGREGLWWIITVLNSLAVIFVFLLRDFLPYGSAFLFAITVLVVTSILKGRGKTYLFTFLVSGFIWAAQQLLPILQTDDWHHYAIFPIIAILATETIELSKLRNLNQVNHLETLNRFARSLASSLETHEVVALVCTAVQKAMNADTYYVGLLKNGELHLELFYDEGEFYPPFVMQLENTLAGYVLKRNESLLLSDVPRDRVRMNLPLFIVGKPKISLSWMGAPMETGGQVIGFMAVASYHRNAFSPDDLNLLKNLANQAAMAIDNAYHHEEVERRSRTDSLTGVLNHRSFLKSLDEKCADALLKNQPLSLIMLDIDHFKRYNDAHGHLVGDQVLCLLTDTIRRFIKSTDLVGRWGGEEFVIALPNASGEEAFKVSMRLQSSVAQLMLSDRNQQAIPAPTISQGIAVFPIEAKEIYDLVDLADQRLYRAKERGRNQIEPVENFWEMPLIPNEPAISEN